MRESADSYDNGSFGRAGYGRPRRGKQRYRFDDDEPNFAKWLAHQPRLTPEDAQDASDGLPEGDRWSTWDQPETPIPKQCTPHQLVADKLFYAGPGGTS